MDTNERNRLIAQLIGDGMSLSEVQKVLEREHGLKITYMDLRLIAADLPVDWSKQEAETKSEPVEDVTQVPADSDETVTDDAGDPNDLLAEAAAGGKTQVNISKLVRPGAIFSGDVTFKSGARAEWAVDQYGRLALTPAEGSERPNEDDIREFQMELQRQLQGQM